MMLKPKQDMPETQDLAVPRHVAIIMDGNGRWAAQRHLPRRAGHREGVDNVRTIVRAAGEMGIEYLTLYGFSSENWQRPQDEVDDLMGLLRLFLRRDLAELHKNGVRVRVIGERDHLEPDIVAMIEESETLTKANQRLQFIIAFNYGGKNEIACAMRRIASKLATGELTSEAITPDLISAHLDTAGIPDPDLIIRTSGEQRISNFLIWQSAYAELLFTDVFWPDFKPDRLEAAIREFNMRERRFGGVMAPQDWH